MPSYSYECKNGHVDTLVMTIAEMEEFEKVIPRCGCGGEVHRLFFTQRPVRFKEGWYEHLGPDPVYCSSAQQVVDEGLKHGTRSKYIRDMGGLWKVSQDRRWV